MKISEIKPGEVEFQGWIENLRDKKSMQFIVIRDLSGKVQVTVVKEELPQIAEIFPPDGGYAGWFEGKVVDMMYFPFFDFYWPEWIPGVGGTYFEFFQYIFNIADASICVGVFLLILFYSSDASRAFNIIGKKEAEEIIREDEK